MNLSFSFEFILIIQLKSMLNKERGDDRVDGRSSDLEMGSIKVSESFSDLDMGSIKVSESLHKSFIDLLIDMSHSIKDISSDLEIGVVKVSNL